VRHNQEYAEIWQCNDKHQGKPQFEPYLIEFFEQSCHDYQVKNANTDENIADKFYYSLGAKKVKKRKPDFDVICMHIRLGHHRGEKPGKKRQQQIETKPVKNDHAIFRTKPAILFHKLLLSPRIDHLRQQ
jgi:hypothetical protein